MNNIEEEPIAAFGTPEGNDGLPRTLKEIQSPSSWTSNTFNMKMANNDGIELLKYIESDKFGTCGGESNDFVNHVDVS